MKKLIDTTSRRVVLEALTPFYSLKTSLFDSSKILLVGPAASAVDEWAELNDLEYDYIVRINSGVKHAVGTGGKLGNRTDFLFHNFTFAGSRAAGGIDCDTLKVHPVSNAVFTTPSAHTLDLFRSGRQFILEELKPPPKIWFLTPSIYRRLCKKFYPFLPTSGSIVIDFLLQSEFEHISIIGFNFFKSAYDNSYKTIGPQYANADAWARSSGLHDPDLDRAYISSLLSKKIVGQRAHIGKSLAEALNI